MRICINFARYFILIFVCVLAHSSFANDFDWIQDREQLGSLGKLAAGYSGAVTCDRLINTEVAGKYLNNAFPGRVFSANETAQIMKFLIGIHSLETNMPGQSSLKATCATVLKAFGPSGITIRGLLD